MLFRSAGVVVSRVASDLDVGSQMIIQLFEKPQVMYIASAIIGGMGLIPGMPTVAFLSLSAVLAGSAYLISKKLAGESFLGRDARKSAAVAVEAPPSVTVPEVEEATWQDIVPIDMLGLEVGYRLIPLVDQAQGGELLKRIKGIRKKFAQDIGFLAPSVHIRDNLEMRPSSYRVLLKGVEVGNGEVFLGQFLAINPGMVTGPVQGAQTTDPAFGLPAVWIDAPQRDQAQAMGYTVVDAGTVVATHLNHLIGTYASELLGRQEVQALLDHLIKDAPKLVENLVPDTVTLPILQKVLQNLLAEGVHIRDMRTIIETIAENPELARDPLALTAQVRVALGRSIVQQIFPGGGELPVITLDVRLERLLIQALQTGGGGDNMAIEPGLADTIMMKTQHAAQQQEQMGYPAVLLVPGQLRSLLARFLRRAIPNLRVISQNELPDTRTIRVTSVVGGQA